MRDDDSIDQEEILEEERPDLDSQGECLYSVGCGRFVQWSGEGEMPDLLQRAVELRDGDMPPYMPLPAHPVDFYLSEGIGGKYKIHWEGSGPLPPEVMNHVQENRTLPRTRANLPEE